MNIFDLLVMRNTGAVCQQCQHFQNDPALIEVAYPGLTVLSSGFASVRDFDGLCAHHQLYLSARDTCPDFLVRLPAAE